MNKHTHTRDLYDSNKFVLLNLYEYNINDTQLHPTSLTYLHTIFIFILIQGIYIHLGIKTLWSFGSAINKLLLLI